MTRSLWEKDSPTIRHSYTSSLRVFGRPESFPFWTVSCLGYPFFVLSCLVNLVWEGLLQWTHGPRSTQTPVRLGTWKFETLACVREWGWGVVNGQTRPKTVNVPFFRTDYVHGGRCSSNPSPVSHCEGLLDLFVTDSLWGLMFRVVTSTFRTK